MNQIPKPTVKSFEDLLAWQKAKQLSLSVYAAFTVCKDYSFSNQIKRASVSVMNNIAEGHERGGDKELRQFLYIAKGSCGEVRSMLDLALELGYIDQIIYEDLRNQSKDTSNLIGGFIRALSSQRSALSQTKS